MSVGARQSKAEKWRRKLSALLMFVCALIPAIAEEAEEETVEEKAGTGIELLDNSPFVWNGYSPPKPGRPKAKPKKNKPKTTVQNLEFRGLFELGGETKALIYDRKEKRGVWARLNEPQEAGWTILNVQELGGSNYAVELDINGRREEISMKEPSDNPVTIKTERTTRPPTPKPSTVSSRVRKNNEERRVTRRRRVVRRK